MLYRVSHTNYNSLYNLYNYKGIGVFSSMELVNSIIAYKVRNEPWFKEHPDGFAITKFYINDDKEFNYKLWETELYLLYCDLPKQENCIDIWIYSSRNLAREKRMKVLEENNYKKTNLKIGRILLDLESWKEWFISWEEAYKALFEETISITYPIYNEEKGVVWKWEEDSGVSVKRNPDDGTCIISWNKKWLTSLANHLLSLAQGEAPIWSHIHFDDSLYLEKWSDELIFERVKE